MHGEGAGIVVGALYCFIALWLAYVLGAQLEKSFPGNSGYGISAAVVGGIFAIFVAAAGYVYVAVPGFMGATIYQK